MDFIPSVARGLKPFHKTSPYSLVVDREELARNYEYVEGVWSVLGEKFRKDFPKEVTVKQAESQEVS